MKVIHKYPLNTNVNRIELPDSFFVLLVAEQQGRLTIWVELNDESPTTLQTIHVLGTGEHVTDNLEHLGSAIAGPFVWHVYLEIEDED